MQPSTLQIWPLGQSVLRAQGGRTERQRPAVRSQGRPGGQLLSASPQRV